MIEALIKSGSKINIIQLSFEIKLGFCICKINIDTEKINNGRPKIFSMVIASFLVIDKNTRPRFFEETILLTDISIDITLKIFFLTLNIIGVNFTDYKLN